MPHVHIEVTIDEDPLSEAAEKLEAKVRAKANQYYCALSFIAIEARASGSPRAIVARVHSALEAGVRALYDKYRTYRTNKSEEFNNLLPPHTILCECNWSRCPGRTLSPATYRRKIRAAL